ncbi:hypothetical protein [Flavobacterium sp. XGLA_31]|uniref:hypothetical protein n=1 Tax=Flavobacterium sp. XGLA_31 TaxID=3447666 RepID=UPI003F2B740C
MLAQSEINRIKHEIAATLKSAAGLSARRTSKLLPVNGLRGKLYEASVLAHVCEKLVTQENLTLKLVGGSKLMLKQKGGPINRAYPYFEIYKNKILWGELFTDLYFNTLSYLFKGSINPQIPGDYHELDIAIIEPNLSNKPQNDKIFLAIECKNTTCEKSMIREVLGFRRELSMFEYTLQRTNFTNWPSPAIYSDPNSIHMLYCSDKNVTKYELNCNRFGILVKHYEM